MQEFQQKILLYLLKALVQAKRFFFHIFFSLFSFIGKGMVFFRNTVGIVFYRYWFRFHRGILSDAISLGGRALVFFGKRGVLQLVLFSFAFVVMIPHTKFFTPDAVIAGRETALYSLVGSNDEFLEIEEVVANTDSVVVGPVQTWRSGSVGVDVGVIDASANVNTVQDLAAISVGGTSLTKPTILSSDSVVALSNNAQNISGTSGRGDIEYYEVQPGDVLGSIAERYGLSVVTILWANDLTSRSYIRPGDRLKILPVDGVVHKVASGDTVSKIAGLYNAEHEKIISFNKLQTGGADIVIGEELIVPGGEKTQPIRTYTAPASVARAFDQVSAPPPSISAPAGTGYLWPTSVRRISQYYGVLHTGLDIAGPVGSPLYASRSGRVIKSQCGWNGGYGCYVILDHGGGINTLYGHSSKLLVSVGETVVQGQTIALMGSTGRSTGPHIHFEVRVNGKRTNPLAYIR